MALTAANKISEGDIQTMIDTIVPGLKNRTKVAKVAGVNGTSPTALAAPLNVLSVAFILAIVTASGAPATKTLLTEGSGADYTLSGGVITIRSNQSANTLLIFYTSHPTYDYTPITMES